MVLKVFRGDMFSTFAQPMQRIVRHHIQQWVATGTVMGNEATCSIGLSVANELLLGLDLGEDEIHHLRAFIEKFCDAFFSLPINLPPFAFHKVWDPSFDLFTVSQSITITGSES
jgi:hypothetical protein